MAFRFWSPRSWDFRHPALFAGIMVALQAFLAGRVSGQEILRNTYGNTALESVARHQPLERSSGGRDTLCLPFFDDFSNPRRWLGAQGGPCNDTVFRSNAAIYPTDLLWEDELAFVNATYPVAPPTYGVATLDGLKRNGRPYSESSTFGPADTMTSKPIRLGGILADSVFLSFFYQSGGFGDSPDSQDSLILEFRNNAGGWAWVWGARDNNGTVLDSFRLAMINVGETRWRHNGFQFRFRNKASRNGNNDHWHLDYIFLDEDRDRGDTLFRDVAFSEPPASMLARYRAMPWRQFRDYQSTSLTPGMQVRVRNMFNTANNTNFQDSLLLSSNEQLIGLSPSESAAVPAMGYTTFNHANQTIPSSVPGYASDDSLSVTWRLRLRPSDDINAFNDTLLVRQDFYNYYAYDDGSAERAYGLIGTGAKLAYRFETNEPDTLHAVFIHWAFVNGGEGDKFFSLIVYQDVDTTGATDTDSVLYQADFLTPRYRDSINGWHVYRLDEPLVVDGIFYIGWLQSQEDLLNVGFDRNTDASKQVFFNLGDSWLRSSLSGAIMMRPQIGPDYTVYPFVSGLPAAPHSPGHFTLWPNPAKDRIQWDGSTLHGERFRLFDAAGRLLKAGTLQGNSLDISAISPGIYVLQRIAPDGQSRTVRFVKTD